MLFAADIHIHSKYSRATSKQLDLEHIWIWAQRKGISVVGTGDFTHPAWFAELEQKLVPAEEGLFRLRPDLERELAAEVPPSCRGEVRFLLSVEISNIYKRDDKTRKVHNLICVPGLDAASRLNAALDRIGNIKSDGRPILGLDSRDLLELTLDSSPEAVLIPAHIWTPWFSALGSRSGFDSIEKCYADLAGHIFAVETGLSSDPPMNWRLSDLDRYTLISNSDAHSPSKLGREANLFDCGLSYPEMMAALGEPAQGGFLGTIEFFPEEGKYHLDGHRKCDMRLWPEETRRLDGICPVCAKPLVLGVMYRVEQLADRAEGFRPEGAASYHSLVGLAQVLGEVHGVGPGSKRVQGHLERLVQRFGAELSILREVPLEELGRQGGSLLEEAVRRMRAGEVHIEGGYDGEFGIVRLIEPGERGKLSGQVSLLGTEAPAPPKKRMLPLQPPTPAPPKEKKKEGRETPDQLGFGFTGGNGGGPGPLSDPLAGLNEGQAAAASHGGSPAVIVAGPGTGKTRTLTRRIACRVHSGLEPDKILAVTFTTRAAGELGQRLEDLLGQGRGRAVRVCTFHSLALAMVNKGRAGSGLDPLRILSDEERLELMSSLLPAGTSRRELIRTAREVSQTSLRGQPHDLLEQYRALLLQRDAMDLDQLIPAAVALLERDGPQREGWQRRYPCVCVDEYQDVNAAQLALLRLLCPAGADLCVIGDPDQAIYRFRGADPHHFLAFSEHYPGAATFSLERSYRTPAALLEAAQGMIRHGPERAESRTWSRVEGPCTVTICAAPTAAAEAEQVVHWVERLVGGTSFFSRDSGRLDPAAEVKVELGADPGELSFGDMAVLYRVGSQAELLLEAFERSAIPHTCSTILPDDGVLAPVLEHLALAEKGGLLQTELSGRRPREALGRLVDRLCPETHRAVAHAQVSWLCALLHEAGGDPGSWVPATMALARGLTEADALDPRAEAVSLLTLHAAKGLEFPVVFIVGCEDGLLPHRFPGGPEPDADDLAEERRLLYVGMTRAQRLLLLTHAGRRRVHGRVRKRSPSRFLKEIPQELQHKICPAPMPRGSKKRQLKLF